MNKIRHIYREITNMACKTKTEFILNEMKRNGIDGVLNGNFITIPLENIEKFDGKVMSLIQKKYELHNRFTNNSQELLDMIPQLKKIDNMESGACAIKGIDIESAVESENPKFHPLLTFIVNASDIPRALNYGIFEIEQHDGKTNVYLFVDSYHMDENEFQLIEMCFQHMNDLTKDKDIQFDVEWLPDHGELDEERF